MYKRAIYMQHRYRHRQNLCTEYAYTLRERVYKATFTPFTLEYNFIYIYIHYILTNLDGTQCITVQSKKKINISIR